MIEWFAWTLKGALMMKTEIYKTDQIKEAAAQLKQGNLVSFPTETVYGLGADATNVEAVKQVYAAKGRPSDNPLIVHVADVQTVEKYALPLSEKAQKLIKTFWPGPLTLIFKLKPGALSSHVTGGLETAAFRMPASEATLSLIREAGVPLVGPSANTSGKPSPTLAMHVYHDLKGKIAGILDDGPTKFGVESTVLDMSTDTPTVLRPGALSIEQLESVIGEVVSNKHHVGLTEVPKAPGMKYKHYAPSAQVYVVDSPSDFKIALEWAGKRPYKVGLMVTEKLYKGFDLPQNVEFFSLGQDVQTASHLLFAGLRKFDDEPEIKIILTEAFDANGIGVAYMNRLNKSAGQTHFNVNKIN